MLRFSNAVLILGSIIASASASAQTLRNATNEQILDELRIRLESGGGQPAVNPVVSASCNGSGPSWVLQIHSVGANGQESSKDLNTGTRDITACNQAVVRINSLADGSGRLRESAEFSLCDGSGPTWVLRRVFFRTDGAVLDLAAADTGSRDYNQCRAQERPAN